MKKLMFATALVASAAAFADPLNANSFEGYTAGVSVTNSQEVTDAGEPINSYFTFDGDSDSSVVKAFGGENAAVPSITRPKHYADSLVGQNNYLALDTEGGTLWRALALDTNHDPEAKAVAAGGTYLDTLVQFTVTEDDAPTTTANDKLAIWLGVSTNGQGEVTGTNLMVRAGYLDDNGSDSFVTATDFTLSTEAPIEAGRWYRLTVKAIGDVTACVAKNSENYDAGYMGFEIYLDGVQLAATEATISTAYMNVATGSDEFHWLDQTTDADFITYLESKKVFPSLEGKVSAYALQGVGFQGTGAIDDLVLTEEAPFLVPPIEFTLTWDEKVTAVSYVLSADTATTNTLTSGTAATIAAGTTGTIELIPTFASGFEFDYVDMGGTQLGLTFAVPTANTNATLVAKASAVEENWVDNPATELTPNTAASTAYPGLAGSALATADAQKLTTWAKAKNIAYNDIKNDTTGTYTEAYLLNCAVADVEDEKAEFKATITIVNGQPVVTSTTANTDGNDYNGTLQLKGKVNLDDAEWTDLNAPSTTYKFYMYELSL